MRKVWTIWVAVWLFFAGYGQRIQDSTAYKALLSNALYNYDALGDSLLWYAAAISEYAAAAPLPEAAIQANKVLGIYHEINAAYDSALHYYHTAEVLAIGQQNEAAQTALLFDKMSVHLEMQQYEQARSLLHLALHRSRIANDAKLMSVAWSNLGIVFRRLGLTDSAYAAYQQSMALKAAMHDSVGMANTRTNMASLLIAEGRYQAALQLLEANLQFYQEQARYGELWYAYMSASEAWRGLGALQAATLYADSALYLIEKYNMPQRRPTLLNSLAALAYARAEYRKAYLLRDSASRLETERISDATRKQITEITEKYKVRQKEQQNKLLASQLANEQLQRRNLWVAALALAVVAVVLLLAWAGIKRRNAALEEKNQLIDRQNQQLIQLNTDKNQLISLVSHNLGQPLSQIQVWAELLEKRNTQSDPQTAAAIQYIQQSVQQGTRLIHQIMNIEKAGANTKPLHLQKVELMQLLQAIVADMQPAALRKKIRLTLQMQDACTLLTDAQHLRQITENLIGNALKYSPNGSRVEVVATPHDNEVSIAVKDNGPGIAAADIPRLFEAYTTGQSQPTGGEHSTGLGLSIVQRLLTELGGTIAVDSEPGRGSTFVVQLPRRQGQY